MKNIIINNSPKAFFHLSFTVYNIVHEAISLFNNIPLNSASKLLLCPVQIILFAFMDNICASVML